MLITEDHPDVLELLDILDRVEERIEELAADRTGDEWMTPKEVMQKLKISRETLYQYRKSKRLAHTRIGRKLFFNRQAVTEFMNSHLQDDYANG